MARNYGHSSWNQWWETEAKKFNALEEKCDWLHGMLEETLGEVRRLGQRVSEAENVNAVLEQKLADLSVAGASAAGVSEIPEAEAPGRAGLKREMPAEAPLVRELPQAKRLASTSDKEKEWEREHPEAKAGLTATSPGLCQNCHGGIVVDSVEEKELKEKWSDWPLRMEPWCKHLGDTLFFERGTRTWPAIEKKLKKRPGRFLVYGSTNKNSRMYICRCSECKSIVTAQYGAWDEEEHQGARDTLAEFVLGRKAEDSKRS